MEIIAKKLTALVEKHLGSNSITWNCLSNPQALEFIYLRDKKIDKPGKARL